MKAKGRIQLTIQISTRQKKELKIIKVQAGTASVIAKSK